MRKFFLSIFILFFLAGYAQHYHVRKFNTDNGLISNEVYNLHQDKHGLLWIYNGRGFSSYDGITFRNFVSRENMEILGDVAEIKGRINYFSTGGFVTHNYFGFNFTKLDSGLMYTYYPDKGAYKRSISVTDKDGFTIIYRHPLTQESKTDTIFCLESATKTDKYAIDVSDKGKYRINYLNDNLGKVWILLSYKNKEGSTKVDLSYFEKGKLIPFKKNIDYSDQCGILVSHKKDIYFYSSDNILKFSGASEKKISLKNVYKSNNGAQIAEDKEGNLWMGYYKGLIKINGDKITYIENPSRQCIKDKIAVYNEKGELGYEEIYDDANYVGHIAIDKKGNIINGNEIYNGKEFTTIDLEGHEYINDILIDTEGQIWFATWKGLFCASPVPIDKLNLKGTINFVSKDGRTIVTSFRRGYLDMSYYIYTDQEFSDSIYIKAPNDNQNYSNIIEARKGSFLNTYGNLYLIREGKFDKLKPELPKNKTNIALYSNDKFAEDYISLMYPDKNGFIWGTTGKCGFLFKTDGAQFWYYGKEDGLSGRISGIYNEANHAIINYIFTSSGIYDVSNGELKLLKNSKLDLESVSIAAIGEREGCFYFICSQYEPNKKHTGYRIKNGTVEKLEQQSTPPAYFGHRFMWHEDYGDGFISLNMSQCYTKTTIDKNTNTFINKPFIIDPLYTPQIPAFYFRNNKLFSFPDAGYLLVFDVRSTESDTLSDPVTIKDFTNFTNIAYSDTLGYLYATTQDKTSIRVNSKAEFLNALLPVVHFLKLTYTSNDETFTLEDSLYKIKLPYNFDPLTINFKAVCLSDGTKLKYKYRLAGLSENWTETNEDNLVYSSLPSGNYTLQIIASNNNKIWNSTPSELIIEILPPWNRTWWAYCMYVIAGFAAIRGYLKNRTKKLEKEKEKLEKTVKERTAEVTLQKHLLEEKQKEIIDSITYAKRIQKSLMPTDKYISRILGKKK